MHVIIKKLLLEIYKEKNNINVFIERKKKYNPIGRNQTELEAKKIDKQVEKFLKNNDLKFLKVCGTVEGLEQLSDVITNKIKGNN